MVDYIDKDPVRVKCKNRQKPGRRKSLTIEIHDYQSQKCHSEIGTINIANHRVFNEKFNIHLQPSFLTEIVIKPIIETTEESLKRFSPQQRNCFFEDEKKLKYFSKYNHDDCVLECRNNFIFDICGCVRFTQPRKKTYANE